MQATKYRELVHGTETQQTHTKHEWSPAVKGGTLGWGSEVQTIMYKIIYKNILYDMEIQSAVYNNCKWSMTFKTRESLDCTPVTYILH